MKIKDRKFCFYFSTLVSIAFIFYLLILISRVKESTSALWFFVVPMYTVVCFFVVYGTVMSLENLFHFRKNGGVKKYRVLVLSVMYLSVVAMLAALLIYSFHLEKKAKSPEITYHEINSLYKNRWVKMDKYVLLSLAGNVSATPEILDNLYHSPFANDVSKLTSLRALISGDFRSLKVRIAGNVNTSLDILEELGDEENWYIQKALALNTNTPISVRNKLRDRGDFFILKILDRTDGE